MNSGELISAVDTSVSHLQQSAEQIESEDVHYAAAIDEVTLAMRSVDTAMAHIRIMHRNLEVIKSRNHTALGSLIEAQTAIAPLRIEETTTNVNARGLSSAIGGLFEGVQETNGKVLQAAETVAPERGDALSALFDDLKTVAGLLREGSDKNGNMQSIANNGLDHGETYRAGLA
jgi:hypothetical protein